MYEVYRAHWKGFLAQFRRLFSRLDLRKVAFFSLSLNMLRRPRRLLMALLLLTVSARVFTGAAEAQVSFTSLATDVGVSKQITLHQSDRNLTPGFNSAEHANPIPDKQKNTVTYKKYLTPENSADLLQSNNKKLAQRQELIRYKKIIYSASPVWVLRANAPPKSLFALSHSSARQNYSFISWENKFGTSTIYNGTGGISRL